QPARFDLEAARRSSDLGAITEAVDAATAAPVRAHRVELRSTEWDETGAARPIRIRGYLVVPLSASVGERKPAVIHAHGLGCRVELSVAVEIARNLDVVALTVSAPGLGDSEGRAVTFDDARSLFRTVPDVRGSWLYAYVYALLRAVTFLSTHPGVDPEG